MHTSLQPASVQLITMTFLTQFGSIMQASNDLRYAGFWIRFGATAVDTFLIMLITLPLLYALYGEAYFLYDGWLYGSVDFLISYVMPAVIVIAFWVHKQATPGKLALSLRVVDARTGDPASAGQYVGRYFAYILSMLPLGLGFLWVAFDARKQGWHDKLAGTVVVRQRRPVAVQFDAAR